MNSKKFVNNFNDYLREDTNLSYNIKHLKNKDYEKNFDKISYSKHYNDLLEKKYDNNLLIEKTKTECLSNNNNILDKNNYIKQGCYKSDIYYNKYSNSPFEFDNFHYLN